MAALLAADGLFSTMAWPAYTVEFDMNFVNYTEVCAESTAVEPWQHPHNVVTGIKACVTCHRSGSSAAAARACFRVRFCNSAASAAALYLG